MRRISRIVSLAVFVAVLPVLAGCADFDPDKLDIFGLTDKKKLPGERKPLFPEGVPGVTQGIPPEYVKGSQAAADTTLAPLPAEPADEAQKRAVTEQKVEEKPKPKRAAKRTRAPKASPKVASKPKPVAAPAQDQQPPQQPAQQQQASPWPSAQPAQGLNGTAPWPAAPPTGTFSRQ